MSAPVILTATMMPSLLCGMCLFFVVAAAAAAAAAAAVAAVVVDHALGPCFGFLFTLYRS